MPIRILVIDEDPLVFHGLGQILNRDRFVVAGHSRDMRSVESYRSAIDVVLMELHRRREDGFSVLRNLTGEFPSVPVLIYSIFDSVGWIQVAIEGGAAGWVKKSDSIDALEFGLTRIHNGQKLWPSDWIARAREGKRAGRRVMHPEAPLTSREESILQRMSKGSTNRAIAEELGISSETVKEHVQKILKKMGVSDRTQAVLLALRRGWIDEGQ
jgi:DNA-binding NarL/FixJ family response regulator